MILITRPEEDALKTARKIDHLGFKSIIAPIIEIKYDFSIYKYNQSISRNIIITSKNALKYISNTKLGDCNLNIVGEKTADFAKKLGFNICAVEENIDSLIHKIRNIYEKNTLFTYFRGDIIHIDLKSELSDFRIEEFICYRQVIIKNNDQNIKKYIEDKIINIILFFSNNNAKAFAKIICTNNLDNMLSNINIIAISEKSIENLSKYNWKKMLIANHPTEDSILKLIEDNYA